MNRWFLFAFVITLVVCLAQALPAPEQETSTPVNQLGDALKNLAEQFTKGVETLKNDPQVQNYLKAGQEAITNTLNKIKEEGSKIIPKTDTTPSSAQ